MPETKVQRSLATPSFVPLPAIGEGVRSGSGEVVLPPNSAVDLAEKKVERLRLRGIFVDLLSLLSSPSISLQSSAADLTIGALVNILNDRPPSAPVVPELVVSFVAANGGVLGTADFRQWRKLAVVRVPVGVPISIESTVTGSGLEGAAKANVAEMFLLAASPKLGSIGEETKSAIAAHSLSLKADAAALREVRTIAQARARVVGGLADALAAADIISRASGEPVLLRSVSSLESAIAAVDDELRGKHARSAMAGESRRQAYSSVG